MSTVLKYYKELWLQKSGKKPYAGRKVDFLHDQVLNVIFDPKKHDRASVARELIGEASGKLLDIGCWGGDSVKAIGVLDTFVEVHGIDLIEESLEKASTLGIKTAKCDLNSDPLPYPPEFFDVVTCLAVIGQIFDPYFVISEIRRVLKRGGFAVINVPNVASLSNRVRLLFGRLPVTSLDPGWDGGQLHYFTMTDTKQLLEDNGFRVTDIRASGGGRVIRQLWPSLLSGTLTFKAVKQ
jgi:SAM-dependent methyltransferase